MATITRVSVQYVERDDQTWAEVSGYVGEALDGASSFPVVDGDRLSALRLAWQDFERAFHPPPEACGEVEAALRAAAN